MINLYRQALTKNGVHIIDPLSPDSSNESRENQIQTRPKTESRPQGGSLLLRSRGEEKHRNA